MAEEGSNTPTDLEITESKALQTVTKVLDLGLHGVGPLKPPLELAAEYLSDDNYADNKSRGKSLVNWETTKNFTTGFLTGLGGWVTLPVAVPAALGASWVIQARMVGAIAVIYGHDLTEDRVRTLVLVSIAGDAGKEVVKRAGVDLSQRAGKAAVSRVPGRVLIDINKKIGFRLLTKGGTRGVVNLGRGVPVLGGLVGGSVDAAACRAVGNAAIRNFSPAPEPIAA